MSANEAVSIRMIPMSDGTVHAYAPCDAGRRTHVAIDAAQYAALVAERDAMRRAAKALLEAVIAEQEWGTNCDPDNFGCVCEGSTVLDPMPLDARPCSTCRSRATKARARALRTALGAERA